MAKNLGELDRHVEVHINYFWRALVISWVSLAGLLSLAVYLYLPVAINDHIHPVETRLATAEANEKNLQATVDDLGKRLETVITELLKKLLAGNVMTANEARTKAEEARSLIAAARRSDILADPAQLLQVSAQLNLLSQAQPSAAPAVWRATTEMVGYRSFLNARLYPDSRPTIKYTGPPGHDNIEVPESGIISNVFQGVVLEGYSQTLDRVIWRNMAFRGLKIRYKGGPTFLDNVQFENCSFEIEPNPNGQRLAQALVFSKSVSINLGISPQELENLPRPPRGQ